MDGERCYESKLTHNTMSQARAQTRTVRSGVQHTKYKVTAPSKNTTNSKYGIQGTLAFVGFSARTRAGQNLSQRLIVTSKTTRREVF